MPSEWKLCIFLKVGLGNLPNFGAAASKGVASNPDMQTGTSTDLLPTVAAVMSIFSKRTFAQNDFIRIPDVPGGLIIQWGKATTGSDGSIFATFPNAFPNKVLMAVCTNLGEYPTGPVSAAVTESNLVSIRLACGVYPDGKPGVAISYFVVGY